MREVTGNDSMIILRKFMKLPAMYKDILLTTNFVNDQFYENDEELFGLKLGRSIHGFMKILPLNELIHIYADGKIADTLLDIRKKALVTVKVQTVYEVVTKYVDPYEYGSRVKEGKKGLLVHEIVHIQRVCPTSSKNKKTLALLRDDSRKTHDRGGQCD